LLGHVVEDAVVFRRSDNMQRGHSYLCRKPTDTRGLGMADYAPRASSQPNVFLLNILMCDSNRENAYARIRGSAAVAQLDRVLGYEPRGRGFESCQPHQLIKVQ
jgi:hypothetical protein